MYKTTYILVVSTVLFLNIAIGSVMAGSIGIEEKQGLAGLEMPCKPQGGDFNGDCTADFNDVIKLAEIWLMSDRVVQASPPDTSRIQAFYMFNENTGDMVRDYSGKRRSAFIEANDISNIWSTGWVGGSVFFDGNTRMAIPPEVFNDINDEMTITVWLNTGSSIISSIDFAAGTTEPNLWDQVSWEPEDINNTQGGWVHYAFVKDANSSCMRIYQNGLVIAHNGDAIQSVNGADTGISYIGSTSGDSDCFIGKVDNLRIYDYALSQSEILFIAAGSGSHIYQPISPYITPLDPYEDGIINFRDFSILANQWMTDLVSP